MMMIIIIFGNEEPAPSFLAVGPCPPLGGGAPKGGGAINSRKACVSYVVVPFASPEARDDTYGTT